MTNTTEENQNLNLHFASDQAIPLPSYDDNGAEEDSYQRPSSFVGKVVGDDASASLESSVWKNSSSFHNTNNSRNNSCRQSNRYSANSSITMTDFDYSAYLVEELGFLDDLAEEEDEDESLPEDETEPRHFPELRRKSTTESFDSVPNLPKRRVSSSSQLPEETVSNKLNSRRVSTRRRNHNQTSKDSQPNKPGRRVSTAAVLNPTARRQDSQPSMPGRRVSSSSNNNKNEEEARTLAQRFAQLSAKEDRSDNIPHRPTRHDSTNWNELLVA